MQMAPMDKKYLRVTNFKDVAQLILPEEISKFQGKTDHYVSTIFYNQKHFDDFQKSKSVAGIRDVTTNKIWFDFDEKDDPEVARKDAIEVVKRLKKNKVPEENIQIWFSGHKGFHIIVPLDRELTIDQVKKLIFGKYAVGISSLDPSVYLPTQVLRIENSKHGTTGLYKVQLTEDELNSDIESIRDIAKENQQIEPTEPKPLPESFYQIKPAEPTVIAPIETKPIIKGEWPEFDQSKVPQGWKSYKWALAQGRFAIGERHHAILIIAATCRALNYGEDMTRAICQTADDLHCTLTGDKPMTDMERDLKSVFSETWQGGQFSPENDEWLKKYCEDNGFNIESGKSLSERAFHMVPIADLYKTKVDKEWMVSKLFPEGGLCLIAGPSKSGKSTLIRQLTKCVLRGEDFLGRKCKRGSVYWFGFEEQQEDLNYGFKRLGIKPDEDLHVHVGAPLSLKAIEDLMTLLCEKKPVMAIIDTLFDLVQVDNENSYNEVKTQMARLSHVARISGTTIVSIHHTKHPQAGESKRGMRAILGSTAILAKVDAALVMESEERRRYVTTAGRSIYPWSYREIVFDNNTLTYSLGPEEEDEWNSAT